MFARRDIECKDSTPLGKLKMKLFSRICTILDGNNKESNLDIAFYAPKKTVGMDEYISKVTFTCQFFTKDVHGIGGDPAQSFFVLPKLATSYLIGLRRYGYDVYWLERGDLDCAEFWTYLQ